MSNTLGYLRGELGKQNVKTQTPVWQNAHLEFGPIKKVAAGRI